jgi:hypothetical protein
MIFEEKLCMSNMEWIFIYDTDQAQINNLCKYFAHVNNIYEGFKCFCKEAFTYLGE